MACDRFGMQGFPRRHRAMVLWLAALAMSLPLGSAGGASTAFAADPAHNPSADEHRDKEGPRGGGRRPVAPSPDELKAVERFAQEHLPNRFNALRKLDATSQEYKWALGYIVGRYRSIENTRENDQALYEQRLQTLEVEDRIFGQVAAGAAVSDAPEEKRQALRQDIANWVALNLQEREQRIDRMAALLDEQRAKLQSDRNDQEGLVDRKMADVERHGIRGLLPDGFRRSFEGRGAAGSGERSQRKRAEAASPGPRQSKESDGPDSDAPSQP